MKRFLFLYNNRFKKCLLHQSNYVPPQELSFRQMAPDSNWNVIDDIEHGRSVLARHWPQPQGQSALLIDSTNLGRYEKDEVN